MSTDTKSKTPDWSDLVPGLAIAFAAGVAAWFILSFGLTNALQRTEPFAAAALYGGNPVTRLEVARALEPKPENGVLTAPLDKAAAVTTSETAIEALRADPLNAEAFRQLARAAQQTGDLAAANRDLDEAYRRSFRQPQVVVQLLQRSLQQGDAADAMRYVDALLRGDAAMLGPAMPILMAIGDQEALRPALISMIGSRPPWRAAFLDEFEKDKRNIAAFMEMYGDLRNGPGALSLGELRNFLYLLVSNGRIDDALTIWLGSLSEDVLAKLPLLYNGEFTLPVNDSPFNWSIAQPPTASVQIAGAPGKPGEKALNVEFAGRRGPFIHVEERLALVPGRYRLTGEYRSDDFQAPRGLQWRVYCWGLSYTLLGQTPLLGVGAARWAPFQADFEVPEQGCPSQFVRLELAARIPSEEIATGGAWFADLAIAQIPAASK